MTSVTGDFKTGIKEISRVLNVKGEIYPISNDSMSLHAKMTDGTTVSGESKIPLVHKQIKKVFLSPQPLHPLPNALEAIERADLVVISPGSLYTSILPNLIIPGIGDALRNRSEEHTSELQSRGHLVCRLLLEKKKKNRKSVKSKQHTTKI